MPQLELDDGFRLYYERHGEGPPVVLAHGAGGNAMSWWRQIPAFSERYSVVTFDHRAFGRSPDIEGGPGRAAFGDDITALVERLDLGPVHFVAHSMGARTAVGLMRHRPDGFRSLTISGSNAGCVDDRLRERKAELQASGALSGSLLQRALAEDYREREPALEWLYRRIRGSTRRALGTSWRRRRKCATTGARRASGCSTAARRCSGSSARRTASSPPSWSASRTS